MPEIDEYQLYYYIDRDMAPLISYSMPKDSLLGVAFRKADSNKIMIRSWIQEQIKEKELEFVENNIKTHAKFPNFIQSFSIPNIPDEMKDSYFETIKYLLEAR